MPPTANMNRAFSIPFMAGLLHAEYEGTLALDYSYFERHWTTISADVERDGEKKEHQK